MNTQILAIVGMPGSGKSTAVDFVKSHAIPSVYFGGIILSAMQKAGLPITPENEKQFRENIRKQHGNDFVIKKVIEEINHLIASGQHRIILDGLYTWTEYKTLKHAFPTEVTLIAFVPPKHLRHQRVAERPDRPLTQAQINTRDYSEIENLEKGGPIAIADYYIINDGPISATHEKLKSILHTINFLPRE
jgi:dephospho-CoA kinase